MRSWVPGWLCGCICIPRRPAELVAEWVIGAFGCRQSAAIRHERENLSTLAVHIFDRLDSPQVINTRIDTDFVHDRDAYKAVNGADMDISPPTIDGRS